MKILVVGGAGKVGSILLPALDAEHDVTIFDRRPVAGREDRSIVADTSDSEAAADAVAGMDALIYMPMGMGPGVPGTPEADIDAAFDVNLRGFYLFLTEALTAGVRRCIYTSSLSVYRDVMERGRIDEDVEPDGWDAYAVSKRLAEKLCVAVASREPRLTIIALRLCGPKTEQEKERLRREYPRVAHLWTYPDDLRRLFLAALTCPTPGAHVIQATGDVRGTQFPGTRATALLGWRPRGD